MVTKLPCICHERKGDCDCDFATAPLTPVQRKAIIVCAAFLMIFFFAMAWAVNQ